MDTVKGIYHNGIVELLKKPEAIEPSDVLVVFPQKKKKIFSIGGLFKNHVIDYEAVDEELKKLSLVKQKKGGALWERLRMNLLKKLIHYLM